MSGRHKYPFNNVCFFENAREHIERDDFSEIPIGKIGGVDGWYFTIQQRIISDEVRYYPFISTDEEKTMFKYRVYSNILKNDGLSTT
uniref:PAZ domain-containing protein n=1 Tax=Caenorhabditis tropicalis TaxID=1561998 RepID=A0A1I7UKV0_9PELO